MAADPLPPPPPSDPVVAEPHLAPVWAGQWAQVTTEHGLTMIQLDAVICFWPSRKGSRLTLVSGLAFDITESPDELRDLFTQGV